MAEAGQVDVEMGPVGWPRPENTPVTSLATTDEGSLATERQEEVEERKVAEREDRGRKEKRLRSVSSDEAEGAGFTGEVEQLLERAWQQAHPEEGSYEDDSQKFHYQIRSRLELFAERFPGGLSLGELGSVLCEILEIIHRDECRPESTSGSKDVFPLPASRAAEYRTEHPSFLQALGYALNSLHGQAICRDACGGQTSRRMLKRLSEAIAGSPLLREPLPSAGFEEFFEAKGIDYEGEEVRLSKPLIWASLEPSLPKEVGMLDLRQFCTGGVLQFVEHFSDFLLPEEDQFVGKPPRVICRSEEWSAVATGLVERGICKVVKESYLHSVGGVPLFNGLFSVGKQEFVGDLEITRLIMNLKPLNAISRSLSGDTGTLPSVTSLGGIYLSDDELLLTSSEDIKCFFYLFKVPDAWVKFLGFGLEAPKPLVPESFGTERGYLAALVLPMGYLNSVAIAQHVHRNVVRQCMGSMVPPVGGECELRRDRVFSSSSFLFRVYLDNFDALRKVDRHTAELLEGTVSEEVTKLREAYEEMGLPRHPKKSVQQSSLAEVQGALVDGDKGIAMAKPAKVARYVKLALEMLKAGRASQRELQVVGGGFVYIAMFRRPLLSGLNQLWRMIVEMEGAPKGVRRALRKEVACEVTRFIALVPLAVMNFRYGFDPMVSASDASSSGGGVCASRGLSPYGKAAALSQVRGDLPEAHDFNQILSIGLFDGISGLRVALDCLGLPIAGHISVEKCPEARRVVESFFPDALFVEDIELIDQEMVTQWALRFSGVSLILVGGGPPCQGVSGLNVDRRGALRDHRSCLFCHVPRVVELCTRCFPWAMIHFMAENVASMDWEDCAVMNEAYDERPWYIDAGDVSLAHRPRLYWVSWEVLQEEGANFRLGTGEKLPLKGEIQLDCALDPSQYLEPGFKLGPGVTCPTFTTARPSAMPLRRPAGLKGCQPHELERWRQDSHRFPPYQYKDVNCVYKGNTYRPPSVAEREAILGFPIGYTRQCMSKASHGSVTYQDCRLTLLGNSWSIPVVAWLLSSLFFILGFGQRLTIQQIVDRLVPGRGTGLQHLLLRPPMKHSTQTVDESRLLVQKLCNLTSIKGEDLLLQTGTEVPVKFHRLRASIPAGLWRWRTVTGWKWSGEAEHINVLELRAVLTTIRWRIERMHQVNIRCVHLVDSLVVLHALSRGRSSSRKMRRTMMRVSALLLASGLQPIWGYVDTHQNPADKPSRRGCQRRWVRKVRK